MTAVVVMAKEPLPGRTKTRLCPPCTPVQAAELAEAALRDTLDAVAGCSASRRVVALDGAPGPWLADGFEIVGQRGDGLDERIAAALEDVAEPVLVIGMDTPQATPELLDLGIGLLEEQDAVLGMSADGGYWALGLARPDPAAVAGVPMSVAHTGAAQRRRLEELGLTVADLPVLRDVDDIADAREVAALIPGSRFARALGSIVEEDGWPCSAAP